MRTVRRRHVAAAAAALGGAALFVYAVQDAGWANVAAGIRRVGWGLLPILGLAGLRFVLRAEAWRLCMPPPARIPFRQAFTAFLAGDALGNITPLGLVASEPTKVFLMRHRLATREAASSLAADLFVYSASIVVVLGVGLLVLLATVPLPVGWRETTIVALLGLGVGVAVALRLLRGTWAAERGRRPEWRARLAGLRESVLRFSAGHPARLWRVFLLHLVFHAVALAEVFLALRWILGESPTLAQAVIFSALDRAVVVVFKFVPFRIGVDEASAGLLATLLFGPVGPGVTLAIVKKVRSLAWAAVGLLLIAAHPAQAGPATDPRGTASPHRT
jgi:hypothetical protein